VGSDPDSPLRYTYEIENALQMRFDAHSRDFKLTLDAIRKSEELSKDLGAQLVILLYAQRPWAFYEVVKGEPRPAWFFEDNLRTHLTLFAKERNIPLIDTHEIFEEVSKTALENKTRLPYFSDGHPNDLGQELIANQVAAFLENQNKQVTTSEKQLSAE
jgi:lysophospholipase L1-like esterase